MSRKINISILCGGQSTEHEISVLSARNIAEGLDKNKYAVSMIYITHTGAWYWIENQNNFATHPQQFVEKNQAEPITVPLGEKNVWMSLRDPKKRFAVDCVFPVLHGTKGEDGTMQGLLEIMDIPYVGSGVLGSALCMDKHVTKEVLRFAGIPTTDWITLKEKEMNDYSYAVVKKKLGSPFFVKPATLGSSVGISKVNNEGEYKAALKSAFKFDSRVLLETLMRGREIECSVLGNEEPIASLPGEIMTGQAHEFYSYTAKYLDPDGAKVITPAKLPTSVVKRVQDLSVQAFKVLHCSGMARVDFFVDGEKVVINELNTIPGFTNISMYPKNWVVSGVTYGDLLDDLIQLSLSQYHNRQALQRFFEHNASPENKQTSISGELNDRLSQ